MCRVEKVAWVCLIKTEWQTVACSSWNCGCFEWTEDLRTPFQRTAQSTFEPDCHLEQKRKGLDQPGLDAHDKYTIFWTALILDLLYSCNHSDRKEARPHDLRMGVNAVKEKFLLPVILRGQCPGAKLRTQDVSPGDDREVSLSLLLCPCFKKVASGTSLVV